MPLQVSSQGVRPGGSVDVELVGGAQRPFLGFMLQARDVATDRPIGTFTLPPGAQAKYLNCANNRQVGVPTGYHWLS
jgi:hypothetical protein